MMAEKPKVSVITITYNQEGYIREALDSFLAQKTEFSFEVIVADDCSTDGTADIVREYHKRYPDIFRPILRTKNIGAQRNFKDAITKTKGEYIALCEGDDFWTDTEKLQKQVNFMESHPDYAVCFHVVRVFFENGEEKDTIFPDRTGHFTTKNLLGGNFIQTNSVMYRKQKDYSKMVSDVMPYDWYLHLYHAQFGKIGFIDQVMSAYRRHAGGMWWDTHSKRDEVWKKHGMAHMALYFELLKMYASSPAYKNIIVGDITEMIRIFLRIDNVYKTTLMQECMDRFSKGSNLLLDVVTRLLSEIYESQERLKSKTDILEKNLSDARDEITQIKSSKRYKYAEKVAHLKSRFKK